MFKIEKPVLITILIVCFLLGLFAGWWYYAIRTIDATCLVEEVENDFRKAQSAGYIYNGVVNLNSPLNNSINFYWRYDFVARSLLDRRIRNAISTCTSKNVVSTLTKKDLDQFDVQAKQFLEAKCE